MSVLLIAFILMLVLVVAAFWVLIRAIALTFKAAAWAVGTATGGNRRRGRAEKGERLSSIEYCANDRCNATWRKDARFCHRCGKARHANLPALAGPRAA